MFILHSVFFQRSKLQEIQSILIIDTIIDKKTIPTVPGLKDQNVQFIKSNSFMTKIGFFGGICG